MSVVRLTGGAPAANQIPPAFMDKATQRVMQKPMLCMCSHLFDASTVSNGVTCPLDGTRVSVQNCVTVEPLGRKIQSWFQNGDIAKAPARNRPPQVAPQARKAVTENPRVHVTSNAHEDDIHGFLRIDVNHFVSTSKDNTVKVWDIAKRKFVQELRPEFAGARGGYRFWGTALGSFSNGYWASGTRDGYITIWGHQGVERLTLQYNPSQGMRDQHKCKDRNKARINCVSELETTKDNTLFYAGVPRSVLLFSAKDRQLLKTYPAHKNDWVYCVEVLDSKDLLVVIGASLEHWNMQGENPHKSPLIRETPGERRGHQRPHISAIKRLDYDRNLLSVALFGGAVKVLDIARRSVVCSWHEHCVGAPRGKERVWAAIPLMPHVIGSSADDKTVKIWDIRQPRSICTLGGNSGRVSSMLKVADYTFITGSCPDNLRGSAEKASITFWDMRKMAPLKGYFKQTQEAASAKGTYNR